MIYGKMNTHAFIPFFILLIAVCPLRAQDTAWADFQQKAAAWRALPVKPPLSEDVRRQRVQAENAFNEKHFNSAVEHYESGLKINPLWPEGHFNAALIYAELKNYDKATLHMRAYLELVPNAPDAEGARDQLYVWQGKVEEEHRPTWVDPATKLMWTRQDNGSDVSIEQAKDYCTKLHLEGHSDWRLASMDELRGIYDETQNVNGAHIKGGIKLSPCCPWVWGTERYKIFFLFNSGYIESRASHFDGHIRALCVRRSGE